MQKTKNGKEQTKRETQQKQNNKYKRKKHLTTFKK